MQFTSAIWPPAPAPFKIYRWLNDLSNTTPVVVYNGEPLAGGRVGDSLAVTGSGQTTLIVAGFNSLPSVTGDNGYAIINPFSSTATSIAFGSAVPSAGDFRLGIAFTDFGHVLGTQGGAGNVLRYTSFSGSTGTLLASPALVSTDERPLNFAVVSGFPLLAAVSTADSHVSLYSLNNPTNPALIGQTNATSGALPTDTRNTGAVAWGEMSGNTATLYAMATDQGIQAFTVQVPAPMPPHIITQPQSQSALELSSATFEVEATAIPAPNYQWYLGNLPIAGATNATYTILSAAYANNGAPIDVVVWNVITNVTHSVTSNVVSLKVIRDTSRPTITRVVPAPGSLQPSLTEIEVDFSKAIVGAQPGDLLINGSPAARVTALAPNVYVYSFSQPPAGTVQITWNLSQAIMDLTSSSNRFGGDSGYSYTLNPAAGSSFVSINEFMAANKTGIHDEDGDASDWIEIYNRGVATVNLSGWYLTDSAKIPTK